MAYLNNDLLGFLGKPFQGMNIFGAKPSATTQLLAKPTSEGGYGLLSQDMLQKAEMQSLGKGLLTTLASYLAQPKNKGYGSALPYLAGSYLEGMTAAQKPFEKLQESAFTNLKLDEYNLNKQKEQRKQNWLNTFGTKDIGTISDADLQEGVRVGEIDVKQYFDIMKDRNKPLDLNVADLKKTDYTPESWALYTSPTINGQPNPYYGNTNALDYETDKYKAEVEQLTQESEWKYGASQINTNEKGGVINKEVKQNLNTVILPYSNEEVLPRMLDSTVPGEERAKLKSNQRQARETLRAGAESLRSERRTIHKLLNSNVLDKITGVQGQFPDYPGGEAANARAFLDTIKQKEFLNNYLNIKKAGGGFGSLSEKEGERLEQIRINLANTQDPKQIAGLLMELDDILANEEKQLYENYMFDYGEYNYGASALPGYSESIYANKDGTGLNTDLFKKADEILGL